MPPQRTASTQRASKPVKSERTHEENQERAYIAASRRSDRSLEARVESARRASEIHKRRTGRALRVTEQDVLNEEMYEEEDDDVNPNTVYRQMTNMGMHGMIDRRFTAYYQHQLQMQQAISNEMNMKSNGYSFNGIAPFQPHQSQAQLQQQQQQQRRMMPQGYGAHLQYPFGMQGANMYPAPQTYRQMPYSLPGGQSHGRSLSMHIPNQSPMVQQQVNGARLSQANSPVSPQAHMLQQAPSSSSLGMPTFTRSPAMSGAQHAGSPMSDNSDHSQHGQQAYYNNNWPFTTDLPGESQRFIEGMQQPMINFNSPQYPVQDLIANNGKPGIQLHTKTSTPIANMNINPLQGSPIVVNKVNDVLPPSMAAIPPPPMSASRTNTPTTEATPTPTPNNNDMPPLQAPKPEDSSNLDAFLQTNYDYDFDGSDTYDFSLSNNADMFGEVQFDGNWEQYLNPSDWSSMNDHKIELNATTDAE